MTHTAGMNMTIVPPKRRMRKASSLTLALLALLLLVPAPPRVAAQLASELRADEDTLAVKPEARPLFRLETTPVGRDAEILTLFGSLNGLGPAEKDSYVPLVSILRDTLGDADPENDRLRHVWMLTYTRPSALQRVASAVPFLYSRVGDKRKAAKHGMPPAVIDLASPERDVWHRLMWTALQNVVFNPYGFVAKTSTGALHHNSAAYRQAHLMRALAILSLYEAETGEKSPFSPVERSEIEGRLLLGDKTMGGLVDDAYLERFRQQQTTKWLDVRGHNWELLRQRAEAEGLYFEPLEMPDGGATHALLWVAREDVAARRARKFDGRFLNIRSPWGDQKLARWDGYSERRHFDSEGRAVPEPVGGGRTSELIPLAIYGLDNPKIPALLVDFRDASNPKRREMSRRVIEEAARNVLALSRYGGIHYFLGRTVFDFVTSRRGMDLNRPSRLRAYTQLKLLLSLDSSLDRKLRGEISERVERVSLNPLENDVEAEARLARQQHAALMAYAKDPKGLVARLERDRRSELTPAQHGRAERVLLRFANVLSLGLYKHRESGTPERLRGSLDRERRLAYHRRFLREVVRSSPLIEVKWNIEDVRRSLKVVAELRPRADSELARAAAKIFDQTADEETRRLCLDSLYRIDNEAAKSALLRIYNSPDTSQELRLLTADYLRSALREDQRIAPGDAKAIAALGQ